MKIPAQYFVYSQIYYEIDKVDSKMKRKKI